MLLSIVKRMILPYLEWRFQEWKGDPALFHVIRNNNEKALRQLIWAGADIKAQDKYGCSLMSRAVWRNRPELIKILLAAGANPDEKDQYGTPLLLQAVQEGHLKCVTALLRGGSLVSTENSFGKNPLKKAIASGDLDILKVLLDAQALDHEHRSLKDLSLYPFNPVSLALIHKKTECLPLLIQNGAEKIPQGEGGAWYGNVHNSMRFPGFSDDAEWELEALIAAGADINCGAKFGLTPLMSGIRKKSFLDSLFKANKIDYDIQDERGYTALHHAAETNQPQVISQLIEKGARRDLRNKDGKMYWELAEPILGGELKNDFFKWEKGFLSQDIEKHFLAPRVRQRI